MPPKRLILLLAVAELSSPRAQSAAQALRAALQSDVRERADGGTA